MRCTKEVLLVGWVLGLGWVLSILRQPAGVLEAQGFSPTRGFSLGRFGAEHKSWFRLEWCTKEMARDDMQVYSQLVRK